MAQILPPYNFVPTTFVYKYSRIRLHSKHAGNFDGNYTIEVHILKPGGLLLAAKCVATKWLGCRDYSGQKTVFVRINYASYD